MYISVHPWLFYPSCEQLQHFFLRDIVQKRPKSLFDCFYLKILRDLNKKYGTKFSLNISYTTGDDFSLPAFPDSYKNEWRDNSNWLKLAFHAHANMPNRPYQDAPPEKLPDHAQRLDTSIRYVTEQGYEPVFFHEGFLGGKEPDAKV